MSLNVLVADGLGINSQEELAAAWQAAGAQAEVVHLNDLFLGRRDLREFQVFCLPGGFSFGDDLGSGKVLANRLRFRRCADGERFFDKLTRWHTAGGFILGICNGFQVLVKIGLLPNTRGTYEQEVTLAPNVSGRFEDRWVRLVAPPEATARLPWMSGLECLELPVRHGEGNLLIGRADLTDELTSRGLILWKYADAGFHPTASYPENPNGSALAAAGMIDVSGRVLGMMPHPEAFIHATLHPNWATRKRQGLTDSQSPDGLKIFERLATHVRRPTTQPAQEEIQCNP